MRTHTHTHIGLTIPLISHLLKQLLPVCRFLFTHPTPTALEAKPTSVMQRIGGKCQDISSLLFAKKSKYARFENSFRLLIKNIFRVLTTLEQTHTKLMQNAWVRRSHPSWETEKKDVFNSTIPWTAAVRQSLIDRLLVTRCCKLSLPAALQAGSEVVNLWPVMG